MEDILYLERAYDAGMKKYRIGNSYIEFTDNMVSRVIVLGPDLIDLNCLLWRNSYYVIYIGRLLEMHENLARSRQIIYELYLLEKIDIKQVQKIRKKMAEIEQIIIEFNRMF